MVQSVELLLDARLEAMVRHEWEALVEAGVTRRLRRGGAPAVPHITVGVAASIPAKVEDALRAIDHGFGLDLRLGGLLLLGGRSSVLVRLVVPSAALLDLQATVSEALRKCPGSRTPWHRDAGHRTSRSPAGSARPTWRRPSTSSVGGPAQMGSSPECAAGTATLAERGR